MILRNILIVLFAPVTFLVIYDIIFYLLPIIDNNYQNISSEYYIYIIAINIFSILLVILLFTIRNKFKLTDYKYKQFTYTISLKWYIVFFLLVFIFINYLIFNVFGTIDYSQFFSNHAKFYALSKRGTAWIFYLIEIMILTLCYDIYINKTTKKKLFILVMIIVLLAFTGGRSNVMIFISFILFIYIVIKKNKINLWFLLFSTILIIVIFVGNSMLRHNIDLETYLYTEKNKLDFNQAFILDDTINKTNEPNNSYFIDFVELKYMLIPRVIWPEKPISTEATRYIYPEIAQRGTSITFGLYANSLLNLGYFSFFFIPLFLFFLTYFYFLSIQNKNKNIISFTILYLSVKSVQFIRGGVIDARIIKLLIVILLSYLVFKIISHRKYYKK
jgi:oligosaccharide repeat unit polymerase